jgi:IS5 family transposase
MILTTYFAKGKEHDFTVFKQSQTKLHQATKLLADLGYQGVGKIHANAKLPHKSSKLHPLTERQKEDNKRLSSKRVRVEHVFGWIKRFKIMSEKYRNRRTRFELRFNLIAGIFNFELNS